MFPYGSRGTSVIDLASKVLNNEEMNASLQLECTNCQFIGDVVDDRLSSLIFSSSNGIMSTKDQLRHISVTFKVILPRMFEPITEGHIIPPNTKNIDVFSGWSEYICQQNYQT
jgi:hypothetical protein